MKEGGHVWPLLYYLDGKGLVVDVAVDTVAVSALLELRRDCADVYKHLRPYNPIECGLCTASVCKRLYAPKYEMSC